MNRETFGHVAIASTVDLPYMKKTISVIFFEKTFTLVSKIIKQYQIGLQN